MSNLEWAVLGAALLCGIAALYSRWAHRRALKRLAEEQRFRRERERFAHHAHPSDYATPEEWVKARQQAMADIERGG